MQTECEIPAPSAAARGEHLGADLAVPDGATGIVVFAHGSGSSRFSPRNRQVAAALNRRGLATLLVDLLTPAEEDRDVVTRQHRFDIELLTERVVAAIDWLSQRGDGVEELPIGSFGASTGAAAALAAAVRRAPQVEAVVSRGGRVDLAGAALAEVRCPALFIVGERDVQVLELNRSAAAAMSVPVDLAVVAGATHLFEEPGADRKSVV